MSRRTGSAKSSICRGNKSQCHCQWLFRKTPGQPHPENPATFRESGWITSSFSPRPTGLDELSLISPLVSVGNGTSRGLIPFFIFFLLLLLIWTLGGSVRCSNVGLRLYRHPSSDEGSMVISKIFISMVIGQGRFRHPLLCPENNLGISPWTWDPIYNQIFCKP